MICSVYVLAGMGTGAGMAAVAYGAGRRRGRKDRATPNRPRGATGPSGPGRSGRHAARRRGTATMRGWPGRRTRHPHESSPPGETSSEEVSPPDDRSGPAGPDDDRDRSGPDGEFDR